MQGNFLVVAESAKVRESLATSLRERGCTVTLASSGGEAIQVVRNVAVDVVLIESRQSEVRVKRLRQRLLRARPDCQVVLVTSFDSVRNSSELLRFGVDDYIVGSRELLDLTGRPRVRGAKPGTHTDDSRGVQALVQVLDVLVGLLELDDSYFGGFSHQVMRLARAVADEMSLDERAVNEVVIATLLRDLGKAGVDHAVLLEEREYSDEQTARMKEHVTGSVRLLEHIDFPWKVLPVIRHHHERYDGKGYPDGLRGREIPLGARIVSAVDAYMAMVSGRPHRPAVTPDEALAELECHAGKQFDPEVVEVVMRIVEKHHTGCSLGQKPMILVVDPQQEFRRLLKMRLLNEGFEVRAVGGLQEAFEGLADNPPHLVLADCDSKEAGAFDLLHKFREREDLHHVPFALLAGSDDRLLKLRALRQGVDDFLLKTADLEEVVARVENILTREAIRRSGGSGRKRRGITGQLENLSLPDIVQILGIGQKTACVTISTGGQTGKIWLRDGSIVHARLGDQNGEPAFYEMVRWVEGEFAIEHGVKTAQRTIETDAMFLIMEGLRRLDEETARSDQAKAG